METNITINPLYLLISLDCVQCTINRIKPVTTYGNQHHHQLLGSFYLFRLCPMYNKQNKASYNIWKPTSPSTPYLFRLCPMYNKQNKHPVTTYGNQHHHQLLISLDCVQCTINRIKPVTTYGNQHHHQLLRSFYLFRLCPMYNKQNKASYNIWKPTSPSSPYLFLSL